MNREERWRIEYISPVDGKKRHCFPRSKNKKEEQIELAKEKGIKVLDCQKLYPFSTWKNQHNFMLVKNRCFNIMRDMENGEVPFNDTEYDRLERLYDKASGFMVKELPVTLVTWDEHQKMTEVAMMATEWRMESCIKHGRYDLIQYCDNQG